MNKSQTWIQRFSGKITYLRLLIRVSTRTRSRANDEVGTRTWGWLATSRRSLIFYAKFNPMKRAHRLSIISPTLDARWPGFWCFLLSLFHILFYTQLSINNITHHTRRATHVAWVLVTLPRSPISHRNDLSRSIYEFPQYTLCRFPQSLVIVRRRPTRTTDLSYNRRGDDPTASPAPPVAARCRRCRPLPPAVAVVCRRRCANRHRRRLWGRRLPSPLPATRHYRHPPVTIAIAAALSYIRCPPSARLHPQNRTTSR